MALHCHSLEIGKMAHSKIVSGVGSLIGFVGSAIAVSSAVRDRHAAHPQDLRRLGIDPVQFDRIRQL